MIPNKFNVFSRNISGGNNNSQISKRQSSLSLAAVISLLIITTIPGCKKDSFLDVQNTTNVSEQTVYSSTSAADLVLNDI